MSTIKVSNLQNASAASPAIVLDANSRATLNGLSYPTEGSLSGRNRIINGDMRIDQRAAIVTTNSSYIVDRWQLGFVTTGAIQCAQSSDGPTGYSNSLLFDVTTADTSIAAGEYGVLQQLVEGLNTSDFAWGTASAQTVTLSFWVKSTTTGTYCVSFRNSAANRSYVATYSVASANTWEYKTITVTGDTSGTWLTTNVVGISIAFCFAVGSTFQTTAGAWQAGNFLGTSAQTNLLASASNEIRITGVQLEAGSVATPFERRSYGQELALCERYYQVYGNVFGIVFHNYSSAQAFGGIPLRTAMRHNPTADYIIPYNNAAVSYYSNGGAGKTLTALSLNAASPNYIQLTVTGTLGTGGDAGHLDANSANALKFTAEL